MVSLKLCSTCWIRVHVLMIVVVSTVMGSLLFMMLAAVEILMLFDYWWSEVQMSLQKTTMLVCVAAMQACP